jgi:hypothetical protein
LSATATRFRDLAEQFNGLALIEYLQDLFTVSPRERYCRDEILSILNLVKNDPDLFQPAVVAAFDAWRTAAQETRRG